MSTVDVEKFYVTAGRKFPLKCIFLVKIVKGAFLPPKDNKFETEAKNAL